MHVPVMLTTASKVFSVALLRTHTDNARGMPCHCSHAVEQHVAAYKQLY